jgi:hypothetical protein
MKRTGVARAPLRHGENLQEKIEAQLDAIKRMPRLIRSLFKAPSVSYITDWLGWRRRPRTSECAMCATSIYERARANRRLRPLAREGAGRRV